VPLKEPPTCSDLDCNLSELLEAYEASRVVKPEKPVRQIFAVERPWMKGRTSSRASRLPASPGTFSKEGSTRSSQKNFWNDS